MSKHILDAVDRAIVNLLVAMSALPASGRPSDTEVRKYVILAIQELASVSSGFKEELLEILKA